MGDTNATVTGNPNDPTVPTQGTSQVQGVPQVGMSQAGTSDAGNDVAAQIEQAKLKFEQDINRLRSVKDRELAEREKKWEAQQAELRAKLDQLATQNMDEQQRAAYEAQKYREEAEKYRTELEQFRATQEAQKQMQEYAEAFQEAFGVDRGKLDFSSQEALANSAWSALLERQRQLQEELEQLKSNPQSATTQTQSRVFTGSGTAPRGRITFSDVKQAYATRVGRAVTDEEVFRAAERGQVDLSQVTE